MFCAKVRKNSPPNNKNQKKNIQQAKTRENYIKFTISSEKQNTISSPIRVREKVIKINIEKKY